MYPTIKIFHYNKTTKQYTYITSTKAKQSIKQAVNDIEFMFNNYHKHRKHIQALINLESYHSFVAYTDK